MLSDRGIIFKAGLIQKASKCQTRPKTISHDHTRPSSSSCTSSSPPTLICLSHHSFLGVAGGSECCSCWLRTLILRSLRPWRCCWYSRRSISRRSCALSAASIRRSLPPLCVRRCVAGATRARDGVVGGGMEALREISDLLGELFLPVTLRLNLLREFKSPD